MQVHEAPKIITHFNLTITIITVINNLFGCTLLLQLLWVAFGLPLLQLKAYCLITSSGAQLNTEFTLWAPGSAAGQQAQQQQGYAVAGQGSASSILLQIVRSSDGLNFPVWPAPLWGYTVAHPGTATPKETKPIFSPFPTFRLFGT